MADPPIPGLDYPRRWPEFEAWFPDEAACTAYLARLRWPDGFRCPRCGAEGAWSASRGRLICRSCRHQTSVTAGTVLAGTRTPLRIWFAAAWHVAHQKGGISALGLQRILGWGSYQTAWSILHKLRRAMVRLEREPLSGIVEVDETLIGATSAPPAAGRGSPTQAFVAIAVEMPPEPALGRVRLARIDDFSADSLVGFVRWAVAPGSTILTDGWRGYGPLIAAGYRHQPTSLRASGELGHVALPGVHRVAALLKRWLLGTHHGAVSQRHLDAYLEEFTFRFNHRRARYRGLLFYRLLQQMVVTPPLPYAALVGRGHHKILGQVERSG